MATNRVASVGLAALALASTWGSPGLAATSFLPLGDAISASGRNTYGRAISADGTVVIGEAVTPGGGFELFRWTADTGFVRHGAMPGDPSGRAFAWECSDDGSTVIGQTNSLGNGTMFRWTPSGGFEALLVSTAAQPRLVSGDGSVLGGLTAGAGSSIGFSWTSAGGQQLHNFGPWATTTDGTRVVGYSGAVRAMQYTAATGVQLLPMPANATGQSVAREITGDGTFVVGDYVAADGRHFFRWSEAAGPEDLGLVGGSNGMVAGISADGKIVTGMTNILGGPTGDAWVWRQGIGRQLLSDILLANGVDLDGWHLDLIWDASRDGTTVTGQASKGGVVTAFVATIPEPTAIAAVVFFGAPMIGARRRR